jgi:methylphosphotriester-DNA--protein-cysteine methyltransferase
MPHPRGRDMENEPEVDLVNQLRKANKRIEIMQKELSDMDKVKRVIVAAGLLSEDKFNEAESLVENLDS